MTGEDGSQRPLSRLGPYALLRPIAQGGMADIYLARRDGAPTDLVPDRPDRRVAIKVLNQQRAAEPESCAMFHDEARLVAMLSHPNIATVLETAVADGHHYLAMEYVHGADLRELLSTAGRAARTLPFEVSLSIVAAAAAGLDHAHRRCSPDGTPLRLVHRDVSLSNIMVAHDGGVKVIDFGIASTAVQTVHTSPGVVRGKASYMSPEQCLGDAVDHRTDIFALGIVLYELTTNSRCFAGKSDFERMLAVVRGQYHLPTAFVTNYPLELEAVVRKCLAADPADRFASCAALIEALEHVARLRNWTLGAAPIAHLMRQLFGTPTSPTLCLPHPGLPLPGLPLPGLPLHGSTDATQPVLSPFDLPHGAEPTARETPSAQRRLAQGTNADGYATEALDGHPPANIGPGTVLAHLAVAGLAGAGLAGAGLARASVVGAGLAGASVVGAALAGTGLAGTGLAGSGLAGSGLAGTGLVGTGLAGTGLAGTSFATSATSAAHAAAATAVAHASGTAIAHASGEAVVVAAAIAHAAAERVAAAEPVGAARHAAASGEAEPVSCLAAANIAHASGAAVVAAAIAHAPAERVAAAEPVAAAEAVAAAEPVACLAADAAANDDDDQPTRGRRPLPRRPSSPHLLLPVSVR